MNGESNRETNQIKEIPSLNENPPLENNNTEPIPSLNEDSLSQNGAEFKNPEDLNVGFTETQPKNLPPIEELKETTEVKVLEQPEMVNQTEMLQQSEGSEDNIQPEEKIEQFPEEQKQPEEKIEQFPEEQKQPEETQIQKPEVENKPQDYAPAMGIAGLLQNSLNDDDHEDIESVDSMENLDCEKLNQMVDEIINDFDRKVENKSYEIEYDPENDFKTKDGSVYTYPIEDMLYKEFRDYDDAPNKIYSVRLCIYKVDTHSKIPYLTFLLKNKMDKYEFIEYTYTNEDETEPHDAFMREVNKKVNNLLQNKIFGGSNLQENNPVLFNPPKNDVLPEPQPIQHQDQDQAQSQPQPVLPEPQPIQEQAQAQAQFQPVLPEIQPFQEQAQPQSQPVLPEMQPFQKQVQPQSQPVVPEMQPIQEQAQPQSQPVLPEIQPIQEQSQSQSQPVLPEMQPIQEQAPPILPQPQVVQNQIQLILPQPQPQIQNTQNQEEHDIQSLQTTNESMQKEPSTEIQSEITESKIQDNPMSMLFNPEKETDETNGPEESFDSEFETMFKGIVPYYSQNIIYVVLNFSNTQMESSKTYKWTSLDEILNERKPNDVLIDSTVKYFLDENEYMKHIQDSFLTPVIIPKRMYLCKKDENGNFVNVEKNGTTDILYERTYISGKGNFFLFSETPILKNEKRELEECLLFYDKNNENVLKDPFFSFFYPKFGEKYMFNRFVKQNTQYVFVKSLDYIAPV
jgi:hypothetical protein